MSPTNAGLGESNKRERGTKLTSPTLNARKRQALESQLSNLTATPTSAASTRLPTAAQGAQMSLYDTWLAEFSVEETPQNATYRVWLLNRTPAQSTSHHGQKSSTGRMGFKSELQYDDCAHTSSTRWHFDNVSVKSEFGEPSSSSNVEISEGAKVKQGLLDAMESIRLNFALAHSKQGPLTRAKSQDFCTDAMRGNKIALAFIQKHFPGDDGRDGVDPKAVRYAIETRPFDLLTSKDALN